MESACEHELVVNDDAAALKYEVPTLSESILLEEDACESIARDWQVIQRWVRERPWRQQVAAAVADRVGGVRGVFGAWKQVIAEIPRKSRRRGGGNRDSAFIY